MRRRSGRDVEGVGGAGVGVKEATHYRSKPRVA